MFDRAVVLSVLLHGSGKGAKKNDSRGSYRLDAKHPQSGSGSTRRRSAGGSGSWSLSII